MVGADALDLLHRLSTNQLVDLPVGRGALTVLTTPKGRIVDLVLVLHPDETLTLFTSPETRQAVAQWIDRYTIVEEVTLEDTTATTAQLAVLGPRAAAVVQAALGPAPADLPLWGCLLAPWSGAPLLVARTDPLGVPGYDLIVPAADAEALWELLTQAGQAWEITPLGQAAAEALRVEAGVPRWGVELGDRYNPLEANLAGAISWEKGCYIGQEVVARLRTYQKVQKHLVGLAFEPGPNPAPGASLLANGQTVGTLTSAAYSPGAGKTLGLGYLRTPYVKVGREIAATAQDGGVAKGTVVRAPEVPETALSAAAMLALGDEEEDEGG
jgi:aminomethyltransferase